MTGDGWDAGPDIRPGDEVRSEPAIRRVAIVTGTRAEFGLLKPVMRAVADHPELELLVIAAGSHLIPPAHTFREVRAAFEVADSIPMQIVGRTTRFDDAEALGRGISRFARSFDRLRPDWVVVLGDRIEAFAAASCASIGGWSVAHIHGGDRAEGVADEAMRHAITKLAHLHLAATEQSAERIRTMGEPSEHVHTVGSPAIDALDSIDEMNDAGVEELGSPQTVVLMHPIGRSDEAEEHGASCVLKALAGQRVLGLDPNHDPGREGIVRALDAADIARATHLDRDRFVGLLKRLTSSGGLLVGNSSAGLIEAAALQLPTVDIGPRQGGRERAGNVVHAQSQTPEAITRALDAARQIHRGSIEHPYGDGKSGRRIASLLALTEPHDQRLLRKRCAY